MLDPRLRLPEQYFEHALRQQLRAFLRTILLTARPWRLWSTIQMEDGARPRRLLFLGTLGVPAMHMLAVIPLIVVYWAYHLASRWCGAPRPPWMRTRLWARHLQEGSAQIAFPYGFECGFWAGYRPDWDVWPHPALVSAFVAWLIMPATFLLLPQTLRRCTIKRVHLARILAYSMPLMPVALASWGLPPLAWACCDRFRSPFFPRIPRWLACIGDIALPVFLVVVLLCSTVFWGFAASRYLKLPRPWGVAFLMAIVSMLLGLGALMLIPSWSMRTWLDIL